MYKTFHPKFVINAQRQTKEVVLPYEEWETILEEMECLDDIRAYDEAKSRPSDPVPFDDVVKKADKD